MNIYKRFGISDSLLDSIKSVTEKTLDPVDPKQAKGTFQARKDKDIDNDGKVTSTDKYLHARRNAISKAMSGKKESKDVIDTKPKIDDRDISTRVNEQQVDEISKKTLGSYVKKAQMDKSFYAADMGRMGSKGDTSSASYDNVKRQHKNRGVGINRAVDRLTKEDIEVQDTACTPIEEAVSVKKQNYSWGKMMTVHHGSETSYPLHPEHQAKIKALGDGEKTSFKDETKRTVTAQRVGDQIHLSSAGSSKKTPVARSHFTEEFDALSEQDYALIHSSSGREVDRGSKEDMVKKARERAQGSHHVAAVQKPPGASTLSRLARKFIPGQGKKQAGERAKSQQYSAGLDRAALKHHPDDKRLATTMKSSEKAQKRYDRISRGENPFRSSPNDTRVKEEVEIEETTLVKFSIDANSYQDHVKKVSQIHKSLRTDHPDKVAKSFGGDGTTGYVKVKNKAHLDAVKAHIRKAGGAIQEEVEVIDELSKATLASYAKKAVSDARFKQGIGKDYEALGKRKRDPDTKAMFARMGRKVRMKAQDREKGAAKAIDRLAKEDVELTQEDIDFINKLNNQ